MGGTKIFVLQLKQIIRTALFVLIGLTIIGLLVYFLIPRGETGSEASSLYIPGTYTSPVSLRDNSIGVQVTVNENEILNISLGDIQEAQLVFYPLIKPTMESLSQEIIKNQTLNIAISEDRRETGSLLLRAINDALTQADPYLSKN